MVPAPLQPTAAGEGHVCRGVCVWGYVFVCVVPAPPLQPTAAGEGHVCRGVCVGVGMCLFVWCGCHYNPQQLVKGMYAEVCVGMCLFVGAGATTTHSSW